MRTAHFDEVLAARIEEQHQELAGRWFERLLTLLPVDATDVFPSSTLLDHIPALIVEIARYVRRPTEDAIAANTAILAKACELGTLRHTQRASLHQVLREYHILGAVLTAFVIEEIERLSLEAPSHSSAALVMRLQHAVDVLAQATVETFVSLYTSTISEQSRRLEEFTRLAAHEWRQPLGTLQVGLELLRHPALDADRATRAWTIVDRSLAHLIGLTRKLESVARLQSTADTPLVQTVSLTTVATEAARQLRDMADARGVQVLVQEEMPEVTLDVGRLELALVNLLSNSVKYADPAKDQRVVEVTATARGGVVRVQVRDNGIGIRAEALSTIFKRFTRAHTDRQDVAELPGLGLGLAIVDDCMAAVGGEVLVESTEGQGTTFVLLLPEHALLPQGFRAGASMSD